MQEGYFNYITRIMEGWWERREFVHGWRQLNRRDRRWTPPYYPALVAALTPGRSPHMDRLAPALVRVEAMPGRPNSSGEWRAPGLSGSFMEQTVAAAVLLADPRRRDRTAYLGLLSVANDVESLERLLTTALEQSWARGCSRLVGPTALSPHLGYGALLDHFNLFPPLYSPYQPPYAPEVLAAVLEPVQTRRLYVAEPAAASAATDPARVRTLALAADDTATHALLTTLLAAQDGDDFPPPDADEAAFLLEWWGALPMTVLVAEVGQTPVGCLLLQPDLSAALRWANGGRHWWHRLWPAWRCARRASAGRVVAWCVKPAYRRRGIGRQLWQTALTMAHQRGWREVGVGPVAEGGVAAATLTRLGAQPRQRYTLYATAD